MTVSYWVLALVFAIFGTICALGLIVYVYQKSEERSNLESAFLIVMLALMVWSGASQVLHHLGKIFK